MTSNKWTLVTVLVATLLTTAYGYGYGYATDHTTTEKEHDSNKHMWSYNVEPAVLGPSAWDTKFADVCGNTKKRQSPIDIVSSEAVYSELLDELDIIIGDADGKTPTTQQKGTVAVELDLPSGNVSQHGSHHVIKDKLAAPSGDKDSLYLFNNGHTVQADMQQDVFLMGAGLGQQYKVAQVHFHWGKDGELGSEHRIDGKMFMLEMHVVTFDVERYSNLGEAVGKKKGVAVFSVLFKKGKHNLQLDTLIDTIKNLTAPEHGHIDKVAIPWVDPASIFPTRLDRYYRYQGSLTTPMCTEEVTWTVFADHPTICPSQMKQFYNVTEGFNTDGARVALVNNWRPPQPLNGRTIYTSFKAEAKDVEYEVKDDDGDGNSGVNIRLQLPTAVLMLLIVALRAHL